MSRITSEQVRRWVRNFDCIYDKHPDATELRELADQMDADAERLKALEAERDRLLDVLAHWAERHCSFNCDADSGCDCRAHASYRAALAGTAPEAIGREGEKAGDEKMSPDEIPIFRANAEDDV